MGKLTFSSPPRCVLSSALNSLSSPPPLCCCRSRSPPLHCLPAILLNFQSSLPVIEGTPFFLFITVILFSSRSQSFVSFQLLHTLFFFPATGATIIFSFFSSLHISPLLQIPSIFSFSAGPKPQPSVLFLQLFAVYLDKSFQKNVSSDFHGSPQ